MDESSTSAAPRIGRPPKVDAEGTPTRDRLLRAAVEACIQFGYEGATLADIARRADVSTPAVYSHFSGKAELLVEASQRELEAISTTPLPGEAGIRELAHHWLRPDFAATRMLIVELHSAATRHPEVADLLADWQRDYAARLRRLAGLAPAQVQTFYLFLLGLSHVDTLRGLDIDDGELVCQTDVLVDTLLAVWFTATPPAGDC